MPANLEVLDNQLGAFARIFPRDTAVAMADAFAATGLRQVQLNLAAIGHSTIPDTAELAGIDFDAIRSAIVDRQLRLWGTSATYNTAHPDEAERQASTVRAAQFIRASTPLNAVAVSLCTGTRDAENMWRAHPDNQSPEAWAALRRSLDELLAAAEHADVLLAVEPEPGNVIAGASQAERLISELGGDARRIGFILDPANLLSTVPRDEHPGTLAHAFDALGPATICVHAKDTVSWADTLDGRGVVDYDQVLRLWDTLPNRVPLVIQDATEAQVPQLRGRLRESYLGVLTR